MLKFVALVAASMFATTCSAGQGDKHACQNLGPFIPSTRTFTAAQLDAIGMAAARQNPAVPQVPFAYANKQWEELKAIARPGDTFRTFDNRDVRSDPSTNFPEGILLMRGNCVIGLVGLVQE